MARQLGVAEFASSHGRLAQAEPAHRAEARLGGLRAGPGESDFAFRCPWLAYFYLFFSREVGPETKNENNARWSDIINTFLFV